MRPERRTQYGIGPVVAGIGFTAAMVTAIWWDSRPDAAPRVAPSSAAAPAPAKPEARPAPPVPSQVVALAEFAERELPGESPEARAAAAEGMRLLADAIATRGDSLLWRDRAKRLREAADKVANAPSSEAAADIAHGTLVQAAEWIAGMHYSGTYAESSEAALAAANAIEGEKPLREQADRLELFFDAAARALGGTSGTST